MCSIIFESDSPELSLIMINLITKLPLATPLRRLTTLIISAQNLSR